MTYQFGSHVSCQGGLLKGVQRAVDTGCDVIQVFSCSPRQWPTPKSVVSVSASGDSNPGAKDDGDAFHDALDQSSIAAPIAHGSYLINLAAPDDQLWQKSLNALILEWNRCEQLRLQGLVLHPGAYTSSSPAEGLDRIAKGVAAAITEVAPQHCNLLLENTAGQGSCLGWQIEQLGWLLAELDSEDVGICWDTCHALAAGYDFRTAAGLKKMVTDLESNHVLPNIQAIHINDSKKECGSRVDRHDHIGQGCIGEDGFKRFLKSRAFRDIPMYLETPKGTDKETGEDLDRLNLGVLRRLAGV